jgi:hypothetical protein
MSQIITVDSVIVCVNPECWSNPKFVASRTNLCLKAWLYNSVTKWVSVVAFLGKWSLQNLLDDDVVYKNGLSGDIAQW